MKFHKGQKVVKVIQGPGVKVAYLCEISNVKEHQVQVLGDEHLWYDAGTGVEVDPTIPGFTSEIIPMDGD